MLVYATHITYIIFTDSPLYSMPSVYWPLLCLLPLYSKFHLLHICFFLFRYYILILLVFVCLNFCLVYKVHLPWPLLTLFPFVNNIWLSNSCNSDFNSANLLLLFFTIDATSDNDRRSVATSRNFSAPSFIYLLLLLLIVN